MSAVLSPEDFVRAWQAAESVSELSKQTGMSSSTLSRRASIYRRKGIPLKLFDASGRPPLDVSALKKIAKDALKAVTE